MCDNVTKSSGSLEAKYKEMGDDSRLFHSAAYFQINLAKIYPHGRWAVTVVDWLAQQTVSCQPGRGCKLERQKLLSSLFLVSFPQQRDLSSFFHPSTHIKSLKILL